jgi:hypothetical protein
VRAFPEEEGSVLYLCLEFGILRNVYAAIYCYLVLLSAFAAWSQGFVDD